MRVRKRKMPTNKTVIPKLLIVLGVVCLSTAVYLAIAWHLDAFREAASLPVAAVIVGVFVAVYTPRIQLRTAAIVAASLALSAIGVIAGGVLAFLPV